MTSHSIFLNSRPPYAILSNPTISLSLPLFLPPPSPESSTTAMSAALFLLCLLSIPISAIANPAPPTDYLISCGSNNIVEEGGLKYIPDDAFITTGNKTTLTNSPDVWPRLRTLRFFPNADASKHCFSFPVIKEAKYLVKTIYFYGGFDGGKQPPVFDQIIDGTKFGIVNTTDDFAGGGSSYYEAVVVAHNKILSVCLARNQHTPTGTSPFISSIEVHHLLDSIYNSTNFKENLLVTVARNSFGSEADIVGFPDDPFNRYWQPMKGNNPAEESKSNATVSTFWNVPPEKVFASAAMASKGQNLTLNWPAFPLPSAHYYMMLYFQDTRAPSPDSWRVFDIYMNGWKFFQSLNISTAGQSVVGAPWPLSGQTEITMVPEKDSPVGPVISAGEVLQIVPLGGKTITRDVVALEEFRKGLNKVPEDWTGDPCLPKGNAWTGVSCSKKVPSRIVALNLTGFGMSGTLDPNIAHLTGLRHLLLGNNKLTGNVPDLGALKSLITLHLENNQFEGPIPSSLGDLPRLKEVNLQNNKLDGVIPETLSKKQGLDFRI
ncbi:probable LRR receptor-like serine/threonine-protein kinase At1g67720 [Andrographis paniculata]|uniref:probable LRR receptor-like serine/threonine-protein kinase At1g67720 n=1 Tax=Andrographis paniculata TaxID=175694 RepID=UPI0021E8D186|nr:probable LRR receptor-like serine/threonine-protein kinase At1g67720 [Andrographis paniculata]